MKQPEPPRYLVQFLEWFCDPQRSEAILGDLYERFEINLTKIGARRASLLFIWQATGFIRWRFRRQHKLNIMSYGILTNYLRTSYRSALRNRKFFFINIVGLIFAVTSVLYCFVYINDELKFDRFHHDLAQVYRLYKHHKLPSENIDLLTAETSGMMGPTMKSEYAEVEEIVRIRSFEDVLLFRDDQHYKTDAWLFADSTFFEVFNFSLLAGDPESALTNARSLVLTESFADKIYGENSPLGETITGFGDVEYVITGVVADPPRQSTLQFDMLASWTTTVPNIGPLSYSWMNNWLAQGIFTFVKLNPTANVKGLEVQLTGMLKKYLPERAEQYFLQLQPFGNAHLLSSSIRNQSGLKLGSSRFLYLLSISAFLIIIIVLTNYVNISLSRASENRLEVGIRKVLGSSNRQLMARFISETLVSTFLASLIGYFILVGLLPFLNAITGKDLPVNVLFSPVILLTLIIFALVFSFILGIYPAYVISRPSLHTTLKKGGSAIKSLGYGNKILLGVQYVVSIILLICASVVLQQTHFLKNKPLGFDKDNIIVMDVDNEVGQKAAVLEAELYKHPNIKSVSTGRTAIGSGSYTTTFIPEGHTTELGTRIFIVDPQFFETYGITPVLGRTFHQHSVADSLGVIVNSSFVEAADWQNPIGKRIKSESYPPGYPIIGVVEDFHYQSLATATIEPMAIFLSIDDNRYASIRLGEGNFEEALAYIESSWNKVATKTPFNFYLVDQWYEQLYQDETQILNAAFIYAGISMLLCILGLYGLLALLLQKKAKEISIRRILGSDIKSIIALMNRPFFGIFIISSMLAIPIAIFILNGWLQDFAYKMDLGILPFIQAAALILFASFFVITILTAKAANSNPVKHLGQQ